MSKLTHKAILAARVYRRYVAYRLFGRTCPVLVTFGITNRCNLRCRYCFASLDNRKGRELSFDEIIDYIDQFIDLGACQIDLQGGEPTMNPDLGRIVRHVVGRGVMCSMATNGFRVGDFLDDLKLCYSVCCSLDGRRETVDASRGAGAYDLAVGALDTMSKAGVATRIHGVLTDLTQPEDIDHLCELARRYHTNVNFVYALDNGEVETGCDETSEFATKIRSIVSYALECKQRGDPITSKMGACRQVLNWPFSPQEIKMTAELSAAERRQLRRLDIRRCLWGHFACFFNTDRKLYVCPRAFEREGFFVSLEGKTVKQGFAELAAKKPCYQCGQMGDLSYSFDLFSWDNLRTWLKF